MMPEYVVKSVIALMSTAAVSFFILGTTCSADFSDNGPPNRAALEAAFGSCGISKPSPGNPPSPLTSAQAQCMTDAGFPPPPDHDPGGPRGPGGPGGREPGNDGSPSGSAEDGS